VSFTPPPHWESIKGFLATDEAQALFRHARAAGALGPVLEIGSYCGKSTICLGLACRERGAAVYALDHHRGSEEHQRGETFHDPDLFDAETGAMDSLREFRRNIDRAGLNDTVIPVVSSSALVARWWNTALGMVFIDGGHSLDDALADYRGWAGFVVRGGRLAIHDVFTDAALGGQAPCAIYRMALDSGLFAEIERVESLAVLQRL